MGYVTLYRKWRPQVFEDVIGQEHIVRTLKNALTENRVAHAYIFSGPRGTGKTSIAKILAKSLNCVKGPTTVPCNECRSCVEITSGVGLDVIEIDAASNRGIDEIRDIREKVKFMPAGGGSKVYIIDEVHMLTPEAFNALLKMLEEPPPHVIFILATTEPHKILPTILSRCQRFDFHRLRTDELAGRVREIAAAEEISIDEESIALIAKHAKGGMRDAVSTLDQLASYTGKMIKAEDVAAMLGLVDTELLFQFADIVGSNDTGGGLRFINDIVESGWDIRQFVKDAAEHFRNLFIAAYADDPDTIINATGEELAGIKKQAAGFSRSRLAEAIESLSGLNNSLRYASDPRLLLELELVKMTAAEGSREQRAESREQSVLSKEQATGNRQQATETKEQAVAEKPVVARKSDSDDAANSSQNVEIASSAKVQPPRKDIADKPIIATETNAIDTIKRVWPAVLTKVKNEKMSTYANLLECRPVSVEGAKVTLEFHDRASVHKKMIQSETAKTFIEGVLRDMTGKPYTILCVEGGRREDAIGESAAREVASSAKDQPPRNERTSRSKDSASENASTKSDANTENQEPESDEVASAAQAPGRDVPSLRGGADRSLANSSGQAPQPPKGETGSNNASGTADASEPKDMMATLTGLFDATVVETKERKDEG